MNEVNPVAAVCGNEVRIFGSLNEKNRRRPLIKILKFTTHGRALMYAQEHDDTEKARQVKHHKG